MASCARAIQQPDGTYLLVLDPTVADISTCAYAVSTGGEAALGSLLAMSPDDALVISGAVCLLWSMAWAIKQVARSLNTGNQNELDY